jgi:putative redox protein
LYAQRKQIPLTRVEVRLRHVQRASGGNQIKDRFERLIALEGNLTPEQRQHLLEIAVRCPVSKTLRQSSDIASLLADAVAAA